MAKGLNRIERFMGLRRLWVVWTYAIRPGWEVTDEAETRTEARWLRDELIEDDGYPKSWVRIRREDEGPPQRQPSAAEIAEVRTAIEGAKD